MLFSFAVTLPPDLKHYYVTTDNYLWQKKKKKTPVKQSLEKTKALRDWGET